MRLTALIHSPGILRTWCVGNAAVLVRSELHTGAAAHARRRARSGRGHFSRTAQLAAAASSAGARTHTHTQQQQGTHIGPGHRNAGCGFGQPSSRSRPSVLPNMESCQDMSCSAKSACVQQQRAARHGAVWQCAAGVQGMLQVLPRATRSARAPLTPDMRPWPYHGQQQEQPQVEEVHMQRPAGPVCTAWCVVHQERVQRQGSATQCMLRTPVCHGAAQGAAHAHGRTRTGAHAPNVCHGHAAGRHLQVVRAQGQLVQQLHLDELLPRHLLSRSSTRCGCVCVCV
jgi:hypothetical protein